MTIIQEEKLSVHEVDKASLFDHVVSQLSDSLAREKRLQRVEVEKKRLSRSGVTYDQFKDLVATVDLVPFRKRPGM